MTSMPRRDHMVLNFSFYPGLILSHRKDVGWRGIGDGVILHIIHIPLSRHSEQVLCKSIMLSSLVSYLLHLLMMLVMIFGENII